ncbi:hypothetical protein StrepF001_18680 [Streptomyces sp. F001]|nr:hypothetical protein StrepF001_18680 [Streptomyces sp. F001]
MIDRELHLPTSWTEDPARRADAKIGDEITFHTKLALTRAMLGWWLWRRPRPLG